MNFIVHESWETQGLEFLFGQQPVRHYRLVEAEIKRLYIIKFERINEDGHQYLQSLIAGHPGDVIELVSNAEYIDVHVDYLVINTKKSSEIRRVNKIKVASDIENQNAWIVEFEDGSVEVISLLTSDTSELSNIEIKYSENA